MNLVPALAEQHAAHLARRARMAGAFTAEPKPLPFAGPPKRGVVVPEPYDLHATVKHKIVVLSAAGFENTRIARRLKITPGVVAGVLYRARAQEHKLLLCDACLILFELGFDTFEIGALVAEPQHIVHNLMAWARDRRGEKR